jgi:hypothetical protein
VIFETDVSVRMHISEDGSGWTAEATEDLGDLIDRVRLSFALAVIRPTKPIIYTMWTTTLFPFGGIQPFPLTDPQFMGHRTPTLLTQDEIDAWGRWIDILTSADMGRLKVAMTRTLRAIAARQDPSDRLIDAVIAWESLFGATNESTLRVSSSLARLLHEAGQSRESAQKTYQKIYQARSDIVHANETKTTVAQIDEYGRIAIEASLSTMRLLLTTHANLLPLKSSTRSTQILLGADTPRANTIESPAQDSDEKS